MISKTSVDWTTDFLAYLQLKGRSPETVKTYGFDLRRFCDFLSQNALEVEAVTPPHIQRFAASLTVEDSKSGKKRGPATIGKCLSAVSSFYEYLRAMSEGTINNPVRAVARPKRPRYGSKPIEPASLEALMSGITNVRDRAILRLFLASGLRLAELQNLNRDSIQVERVEKMGQERVLGFGSTIGKGNKQRVFLVDIATVEVVGAYLETRQDDNPALFVSNRNLRLSRRSIEDILHRWCKRAGIPRARVHALRHSYANRLANSGISSVVLQTLMGHASPTTTQIYFRIERARLATEYFAALETSQF